ncbi:hypothetical protein Agub_g11975 [Astrephomene gubernaculifera]|uniref:Coenzyme Q-binding protein COQ10 START domain-containing protein n=1 Tax=Astrephomene gubernaculifera TaxID=47775 RepID=A0AAD3DXU1_9CHLO|nr:hypothetical protein Agub_g11975 [Astrephomene gubernaculifera]
MSGMTEATSQTAESMNVKLAQEYQQGHQEAKAALTSSEPSVDPTGVTSGGEAIHALPPPPPGLAGSSSASGKNFDVTVSNKAGYLCHVHVTGNWPVPPEVPFAIFTHPDNSAIFRDIQRVGSRKVIKTEPGYKEVQVEQLQDFQVLWLRRTYSTWLRVVEDTRDPDCLHITFELLRSDVLAKFGGSWRLEAVRDPASGRVVGCRGELVQDVLPKGMPSFMSRLPLLGGALRAISVRAVTRVMEDFNTALDKVRAGHASGRSTEAVLRQLCGSVAEAAHCNGAVASFAFDTAEEEEEEEAEAGVEEGKGTKEEGVAEAKGSEVRKEEGAGAGSSTASEGVPTGVVVGEGAGLAERMEKQAVVSAPTGKGAAAAAAAAAGAGAVCVVAEAVAGGAEGGVEGA